MGSLGLIVGLYADKFDQMSTVTNFIIVPLSFLSGTFYSIDRLPDFLRVLSNYNPFFHMIDGFRYSFIGQLDGSVLFGITLLTFLSSLWFPNLKWSNPPTFGPNPSIIFFDPLAFIAAIVLPWKEFFIHKIIFFFGFPIE